jgi:replicative DNA helicase
MRSDAPRIKSGELEVPPIIPTGIYALDNKLNGGLPREKVCVIAARTSHGKTATAVRLAVNMALAGRKVNVFWLEDSETEFDMRVIAALSRQPLPSVLAAYRAGTLDNVIDKIPRDKLDKWVNVRTLWMERPGIRDIAETIETKCSRNSVVLIDHLGEIAYEPGPKYETMGEGLRMIRAAARKSEVLVVAMTQLNRAWDQRKAASPNPDNVRPVLSDIENSGQIEQIARVCIIAEKRYVRQGDGDVATGQYFYHVWKPYAAVAECKWDGSTATPDNPDPVVVTPYQDGEDDDA